jgi:hypothetical protein
VGTAASRRSAFLGFFTPASSSLTHTVWQPIYDNGGYRMKVISRSYNPESDDFEKLCQFILKDNQAKREYFVWQPGRMIDWKYGLW